MRKYRDMAGFRFGMLLGVRRVEDEIAPRGSKGHFGYSNVIVAEK